MRTSGIWSCAIVLLFDTSLLAASPQTVSLNVDGRDEMHFSNNSLTIKHLSWAYPDTLVIDSIPKPLSFNGDTSNSIPVPTSGVYWVKKTAGRDGGYAVQTSDGFMLAAIDNPNGPDTYRFQLADAPGAVSTDWMHVTANPAGPANVHSFNGLNGYDPGTPAGSVITFSLTVDGTDELQFVGGNLVIHHLSWDDPTSLTINGQSKQLIWTNNFSNPIPLHLPDQFAFAQLSGRSPLYAVDTASGLLVSAADELVGNDTYRFTLTAVPEPSATFALCLGGTLLLKRRRGRPSTRH
ncbi:MAG: hypothetical protein JWN24_2190 [Phycisphaerales bacterium]|nr:hypothetical protein [Phycisphaerales bacterium]